MIMEKRKRRRRRRRILVILAVYRYAAPRGDAHDDS
jgi:hypothetical protein